MDIAAVEHLIRTLTVMEQRVALAKVYAGSYRHASSIHQDGALNDLHEQMGRLNEAALDYDKAFERMTAPVVEVTDEGD